MRWVAACVAGAVILVGAVVGGGLFLFSSHAARPTAASATATAAPSRPTAAPAKPSPQPLTSVDEHTFASPTGNITCRMDRRYVSCDVAQYSWSLTAADTASCGEAALAGLNLTDGAARFDCRTDVLVPDPQRVLGYGQSVTVGRITCSSASTGMTCRNRRDGHGFFVSRQRYRKF